MISLELFEKILTDIQEHEFKNDTLSNIMVCPDCTGWIDFGSNLIDNTLKILNDVFGLPEDDDLIWAWMYDMPDGKRYLYEKDKNIKYNINTAKSLYLYLTKQYDDIIEPDTPSNETKTYPQSNLTIDEIMELWNKND